MENRFDNSKNDLPRELAQVEFRLKRFMPGCGLAIIVATVPMILPLYRLLKERAAEPPVQQEQSPRPTARDSPNLK